MRDSDQIRPLASPARPDDPDRRRILGGVATGALLLCLPAGAVLTGHLPGLAQLRGGWVLAAGDV